MDKNRINIIIGIILILFIFLFLINSSKEELKTKASESRYNEMSPTEYYKEMKSENLQYADIAWHAQNTYGWNCSEIISLGENISTNAKELKDQYLISQTIGYYNIATCSSGEKLRIYPRSNTYPIITNINGGFE